MQSPTTHIAFEKLASRLEGEVSTDRATRILYATDASVYRVLPAAVAFPKSDADVAAIAAFAAEHHIPITARTAGTSLSGQAVGEGLVVDFSVHFGNILEINPEEKWVRVQPGVIRDDLNRALAQYGLFFGPNTSTANRCMMGGMVGNNSSGTTSIRYGVTRDKVIEISAVLGDGSTAVFREVSPQDSVKRASESTREGKIYAGIAELLSRPG
ncbi:MAG: FAD-binding oxidoreductase, partial [Flavobacteriales bacterium]|nr:FAD-binding oxidoreductase [Flavobacteriales bacterium]